MKAVTPFTVLVRAFFAQFFTSENVASDMRMRQAIVFVFAFIVTPSLFLIVSIFPQYSLLTIPVSRRWVSLGSAFRYATVRGEMAQNMLEWIVAVLCGYAIVAAGLVAVFVWDSLTFDRRDVMVLGPLPMPRRTLVVAKLSALALFLIGSAVGINLFNAFVFAFTMSTSSHGRYWIVAFAGNLASVLVVTTSAALLAFAAIVTIRSTVALAGGARFSSIAASVLQFVFVSALLVFLVAVVAPPARPGLLHIPDTLSPPITWFVALFDVLRRSDRGAWDEYLALSRSALMVVPALVASALVSSIAANHRQMQIALAGSASSDFRRARFTRGIAHALLFRDAIGRAAADFMLMTLARNPVQRAPIAINSAIGLGLIVVSLSRARGDLAAALQPMPLMLAYWMAIGVRAAFFVPSQLPAAWTWIVNAPDRLASYRAAARASIVAVVAPVTTALAVAIGGWSHGAVTAAVVTAFAAFLAITIDFVPFTRAYRAGHARLRRLWPMYLIGAYAMSDGVVALETRVRSDPVPITIMVAVFLAIAVAFDAAGRYRSRGWRLAQDPGDEESDITVLRLGAAENRTLQTGSARL